MKAPYGICLYEALFLLAVDEEMCPGKKKSFQRVILSARTCARRLQELEGGGWILTPQIARKIILFLRIVVDERGEITVTAQLRYYKVVQIWPGLICV